MADRNCESERRAGRRWADKTVVIKERSREIFPKERYLYGASSIRENPLIVGGGTGIAIAECDRHEKCDLEERDARATRRAGMKGREGREGGGGGGGGKGVERGIKATVVVPETEYNV